jgi:hypothetical protein
MVSRALLVSGALSLVLATGAYHATPYIPASQGSWLISSAQAQSAMTITDVKVVSEFVTYSLPRLEITGSSLSEADVKALFDGSKLGTLHERLAKFSAQEIRIPDLILDQKVGKTIQKTTYKDSILKNVINGKISSFVAGGLTFTSQEADSKTLTGTGGEITADEIDLTTIAQLYVSTSPNTLGNEFKKLYGKYTAKDFVFTGGKGEKITIARINGSDFKAKAGTMSWTDALKEFSAVDDFDKLTPEKKKSVLTALSDLFSNIDLGWFEVVDLAVNDPNEASNAVVKIGRMAYGSPQSLNDSMRELRLESLSVTAKDGNAKIGLISSKGFSAQSTFDALKDAVLKDDAKFEKVNPRSLIPTLGTLRFEGLEFDVPDTSAKNKKGQKSLADAATLPAPNIKFTVKQASITAEKPINGIPTNIQYAVDGFNMPLPENTKEEGLKDLVEMGYRQLALSFAFKADWLESSKEVRLSEMSYRGEQMGSYNTRLTLGNITKDVFNLDTAVATVALMGATVKTLDMNLENAGLFEKLIEREAKKAKKTSEELRREYAATAAVAIPALLGNSENAQRIAQAVARFIAKPSKLMISATSKKPEGLGLTDVMSDLTPQGVLEKIDVKATAE